MALSKDDVLAALKTVKDPEIQRDLVSLGAIKKCAVCDNAVGVTINLPAKGAEARERVRAEATKAIQRLADDRGETLAALDVDFSVSLSGGKPDPKAETPQGQAPKKENVSHILAVGAGKGGVGKSTVSVNLAVGLARAGHSVGLLDGDIYGPSCPTLLGLKDQEPKTMGNQILPFTAHGIRTMTIGKLVDPEKPLIWRGPMAHGAFKQLADQTRWGELDYLVIDLPPGTGDVPLTMAQSMQLDGAVIVCTPQKVAQDDAIRAVRMFQSLGIDIIGVVENMSYFIGDDGKEYDLFGRGGAEMMAQRLGLPFLGALPIHMELRENSDSGDATANFTGNPTLKKELNVLVDQLEKQVMIASQRRSASAPSLTIS
jgi:ATP-binding protein involved in chromosome partitioning